AVRVAMTVIARDVRSATRVVVDADAHVVGEVRVPRLNADLSAHADVASATAVPLLSNEGICSPGLKLHGAGFIISSGEAGRLLESDPANEHVVRPYLNGRDLVN